MKGRVQAAGRRLRAKVGPRGASVDGQVVPAVRKDPSSESSAIEPAIAPEAPSLHCWELGHYYSPVPDSRELALEPARSRVWSATPRQMQGVDWRADEQVAFVRERLCKQAPLSFPDGPTGRADEYHSANELFSLADAWALQAMLRELRPARMIEVGSGWSSLVTARVSRECLDERIDFTCIEPYPADFIAAGVEGVSRLIASPVQDVPVERFLELEAGDVLFIDTAHVVKTGGDVLYLYHEVVPRLKPGVAVHIHDIFLPWDYPEDWVLGGRGWNEQYLVQSFLAFNDAFEVMLGVAWMCRAHPELLVTAMPGLDPVRQGGGSLWLRRRTH